MASSQSNTSYRSPAETLANDLVDRIEVVLTTAQRAGQPIEIDPYRAQLFELFVLADASGLIEDEGPQDLSCDGIGRELSGRWDLANSVGAGFAQPATLPTAQLSKLRVLWSFMRMWMEWTYAWRRWSEFHDSPAERNPPID